MESPRRKSVEVAPLQSGGSLYGFLLIGRWPADTVEWTKFLVLAVRMAAVPGLLPVSTVFRVREELPEEPQPEAVGLIVAEGSLLGESALAPGQFANPQPPALVVLHPPSSTLGSVPDYDVASLSLDAERGRAAQRSLGVLVPNALQAGATWIAVRAEVVDGMLRLEVEDDAGGFDPDLQVGRGLDALRREFGPDRLQLVRTTHGTRATTSIALHE